MNLYYGCGHKAPRKKVSTSCWVNIHNSYDNLGVSPRNIEYKLCLFNFKPFLKHSQTHVYNSDWLSVCISHSNLLHLNCVWFPSDLNLTASQPIAWACPKDGKELLGDFSTALGKHVATIDVILASLQSWSRDLATSDVDVPTKITTAFSSSSKTNPPKSELWKTVRRFLRD